MSQDDADRVSKQWTRFRAEMDLDEYYSRWRRLEATGKSPHGEADFIESLHPRSVLDAGCGMGRVAIELARRGIDTVGVDLDPDLLDYARRSEPAIQWLLDDLATMDLGRSFDVVAMPGNVMIFCRAEDRAAIIRNTSAHLEPEGSLIAGFQLDAGGAPLSLDEYDELCGAADLALVERWSTWDREPYRGGNYAVSVHRRAIEGVSRP
jgi:SAM-dependent methyltransferase